MRIDEHEDWIDGFDTWDQVWAHLHDDWLRIEDVRQALEISYGYEDLAVLDWRGNLRARHRRGLHRLGFRARSRGGLSTWSWDVEEAVRRANLDDFAHPLEAMLEGRSVLAQPDRIRQLRLRHARTQLVTQQVQLVVREVFRSSPGDLLVVVHLEPDWFGEDWDEEEDEDWQLPTG